MKKLLFLAALLLHATLAWADPERVGFPADYQQSFTFYATHNRPDNNQVRYLYANDIAMQGAQADGALANGAVLLIEIYKARLDDDQKPVVGSDGFYEKDQLAAYAVMEKQPGWGDEFPEAIRNGNWNYALFTPAKTHKPGVDEAECLACHKPLAEDDYLFSWDELAKKVDPQ